MELFFYMKVFFHSFGKKNNVRGKKIYPPIMKNCCLTTPDSMT